MVTTRKATLEDLTILLDFEQELIKAERPFDSTFKEGKISYYDIEKMIVADEVELIVAEENNEIIASGYASIIIPKSYFKFNKFAYLGFMYTKPLHRGRGINKLVVETLFNWVRSQDTDEVRLDVYDSNYGAIKAYEKVGFQRHLLKMRMTLE